MMNPSRVFLLCISLIGILSCPHFDRNLERWSDISTWSDNELPSGEDDVVIEKRILLDVSSVNVNSITVQNGGQLVWDPDVEIRVRVRYILIQYGGRIDIGSEECPFETPTQITLFGRRNEYNIDEFAEKFIGVNAGGTLEIHGKEKFPWTKLTKTVHKIDSAHGLILQHSLEDYNELSKKTDGFFVYVISPYDGTVVDFGSFKVGHDKLKLRQKEIPKMTTFLEGIETGMVVIISKRRYISNNEELTGIYDILESMSTATLNTASITEFGAYNLIFVAGGGGIDESISNTEDTDGLYRASASLTLFESKMKVTAWSEVGPKRSDCFNDVAITDTDYSYPKLDLLDDVFWEVGDLVVLASTDTDWKQAEMATVVQCDGCESNQIRVDLEPEFDHWGTMIDGVDERGEVMLLSRNILIEGEVQTSCPEENQNCGKYDPPDRIKFEDDTFGGHFKVVEGFSDVHVEHAEFYHMGQQTDLGRYAIHFHMCFDVGDSLYDSPAYVRNNSIHHTLSRCVTVHGTHNLTVEDNVCFLTYGHSYFLEDGGEEDNLIAGNIGLGTMYGDIIVTDRDGPTTFWMANPRNTLRNNVAAGGDHTGIWYIFPTKPMGPSADYDMIDEFEARRTPITEFYNNVAHSYGNSGLFIDHFLDSDTGEIIRDNMYNPVDDDGNTIRVHVSYLTAYKNKRQNAWLRGGEIMVDHCSLADSGIGLIFLSVNNGSQFVEDCVILGLTENQGTPIVIRDNTPPIQGFVWHYGPIFIDGVYFNHFSNGADANGNEYKSMAIGFRTTNPTPSSPVNSIKNAYFGFDDTTLPGGGNRVYDGQPFESNFFGDMDGDKSATFVDLDGTVSGHGYGNFVKNRPFTRTDQCLHRENWNDIIFCKYEYGKLDFIIRSTQDVSKTLPVMTRDDNPDASMTLTAINSAEFPVILGGKVSYLAHFTSYVPKEFVVRGLGVKRDYSVRFGICVGSNAQFTLSKQNRVDDPKDPWVFVNSIEELDAAETSKYVFYDENIGILFFKFMNYLDRAEDDYYECPGNDYRGCPEVQITLDANYYNEKKFYDCRDEAYAASESSYVRDPEGWTNGEPYEDDTVLSATSNGYPNGFGAGETKPFKVGVTTASRTLTIKSLEDADKEVPNTELDTDDRSVKSDEEIDELLLELIDKIAQRRITN